MYKSFKSGITFIAFILNISKSDIKLETNITLPLREQVILVT